MKKTFFNPLILPIFLLFFGCGTEEYESRLHQSLSNVTSKFSTALNPEAAVPGTAVRLCLPKTMQLVDAAEARRGKCPLFEIPGLKATYEGAIEDAEHNKQHYYLYVAVTDLGGNSFLPTRNFLNELQQKFPADMPNGSTEVNKSFSAETPDGRAVKCEEFHFKCQQEFFCTSKDNQPSYPGMKGSLRCLCHEENGVVTTLIYRHPSSLDDRHAADFDSDWITLVAGTLKVEAPAAK
jgi:hypothetical protein